MRTVERATERLDPVVSGRSHSERTIGGRYRLLVRCGLGATAEVWRARDEILGRDVAVKLLHPHLVQDDDARARLESEARAVAGLSHRAIVAVHDVIVTDEEAAIVLGYVPGGSLAERLARDGALAPSLAASIAAEIADGLAHAHGQGLIHRDVKPSNVLLGDDGQPRLADFGIARALDSSGLTVSGNVMGTLRYMAPEHLAGAPPSEASDVFALGVVLYEMLAGRSAFDAANPVALVEQHRRAPRPIDGAPPALMDICRAALQPDPDRRLSSARELASRLRAWLRDPGSVVGPAWLAGGVAVGAWDAGVASRTTAAVPISADGPARAGRRRTAILGGAAVAVLVAVAATVAAPAAAPPGDGASRQPAAVDAGAPTVSPAGEQVRAGGGRREERVTPSPKATRDDSDRRSGKGDRRRGGGGDDDDD